jgi:hypothetical protein
MYAIVDKVVVGIILALALFYVWKRFFRSRRGGSGQTGCGCCTGSCPSRTVPLEEEDSSRDQRA